MEKIHEKGSKRDGRSRGRFMIFAIFILIEILLMSLYGCGLEFKKWEKTEEKLEMRNKVLNEALHLACQQIAKEKGRAELEIGDNFMRKAAEKVKNENDNQFFY